MDDALGTEPLSPVTSVCIERRDAVDYGHVQIAQGHSPVGPNEDILAIGVEVRGVCAPQLRRRAVQLLLEALIAQRLPTVSA